MLSDDFADFDFFGAMVDGGWVCDAGGAFRGSSRNSLPLEAEFRGNLAAM